MDSIDGKTKEKLERQKNGEIKKDKLPEIIHNLLEAIGENPNREDLKETWKRRTPNMWKTLTQGYREKEKPELTTFPTETKEMIVKKDIPFHSLCEHHLLPFKGKVDIGYIPNGEIIGISKLIRYTKWKSRKLNTQENLTKEIAQGLTKELETKGVIVKIEAEHLCESMRGIETNNTKTITTHKTEKFQNSDQAEELKKEFRHKTG